MNLDEYYRDPAIKPKLAPGIRKPTYQLPDNDPALYAKWCQDRIEENKKQYQKQISHEKPVDYNNASVVPLFDVVGIRRYRNAANHDVHESRLSI